MPLPLLLAIPLAAAAATTSTTTTVVVGVGAGVGGVALGATGGWWFFGSSNTTPSEEHLASLETQNRMTQKRITDANKAVELLCRETTALAAEVKSTTSSTTASVERLRELSEKISKTSVRLTAAVEAAKDSSRTLADSLPQLKEIAKKSRLKGAAAVTTLNELNGLLAQKEDALIKTANDIKTLQHTVDDQTATITQLSGAVKTLTSESNVQKKIIVKKDEEITKLKKVAGHLNDQCRFFKQQMTTKPAPAPHTASPAAHVS